MLTCVSVHGTKVSVAFIGATGLGCWLALSDNACRELLVFSRVFDDSAVYITKHGYRDLGDIRVMFMY